MSNQSFLVKFVIWLMVFLMSVGFAALIISPFLGGGSLFGGDSGRSATLDLLDEARADVRKDDCTDTDPKPTGARLKRCREALQTLGSAYATLAIPEEGATEVPKDYKRNIQRATDAYKSAYGLDPKNREAAIQYASFLRDNGKAKQSLPIWASLVKRFPTEEDFLLQSGFAQQYAGENDQAISTFRAFLKKFPDSGQVESVKEQIKSLEEQAKPGAGGAGGAPINIG